MAHLKGGTRQIKDLARLVSNSGEQTLLYRLVQQNAATFFAQAAAQACDDQSV